MRNAKDRPKINILAPCVREQQQVYKKHKNEHPQRSAQIQHANIMYKSIAKRI